MENRNEPLKPAEWLIANGDKWLSDYEKMQKYADYIKSFQPESVEDAIKTYAFKITGNRSGRVEMSFPAYTKEIIEAARFGASLTRPIDWDKLKEEWELHYKVTNWQTCDAGERIFDWFKQRMGGVDNSVAFAEWISVKDKLPEDQQNVLFIVESQGEWYDGRMFGGKYVGGKYPTFSIPGIGFSASYWQPMPDYPAFLNQKDKK